MVGVLTSAVGYNSPFIISPGLDGVDHHAPHLEVVGLVDAYGLIFGVGWSQFYVALVAVRQVEVFDGEFVVHIGHHYRAVGWFARLVDHRDVAVVDAGIHHRVAFNATVEGSFGMLYQVAVEVKALVQVFLCRAGKAGPDFGRELKVQFLLKFAVYDVDTVHKCDYMCCAKIQLLCEKTIANVRNNCYCIIDFSRL